jgi:hypothetical protein
LAKDLLGPLAEERGGAISSEPKMEAMGFAPAMIGFREESEVDEGCWGEGGGVPGNYHNLWEKQLLSGLWGSSHRTRRAMPLQKYYCKARNIIW